MENINCKATVEAIRNELREYISKYKLQSLVIGLSGGIDSAICTALAAPVCKALGVKLIGRSISIETNKPDEKERGEMIGKAFCDSFEAIDLTRLYGEHLKDVEESDDTGETDRQVRIRLGNIKARMRMVYLYNLAQKHRGIVLSTDNYTEYLLGFWTLHGDVGDYGMIQEFWKTEVYALSQWLVDADDMPEAGRLALQLCIDCVPTDGLGITNSDLDQLGAASYNEVDEVLQTYLKDAGSVDHNHPVMQRHFNSMYKRSNPYNLRRDDVLKVK
jgi:NAD+ synthetase